MGKKSDDDFRSRFVAGRTQALATVYLTRLPELEVVEPADNRGIDLVVTIRQPEESEPSLRTFGVRLHGTVPPATVAGANAAVEPAVRAFQRLGSFPYPVVLFFFTMRDDRGYYTWLLEPLVTAAHEAKLAAREIADCRELTTDTLTELVAAVNAWYDALYAELAA